MGAGASGTTGSGERWGYQTLFSGHVPAVADWTESETIGRTEGTSRHLHVLAPTRPPPRPPLPSRRMHIRFQAHWSPYNSGLLAGEALVSG